MGDMMPFRQSTRNRRNKITTLTYATSSQLTQEIPRVGYLSGIRLFFRGSITYSGSSTTADRGPWQLLNRVKVNLNQGSQSLVDVSGYGLYLSSIQTGLNWLVNKAGAGDTTPATDIYAFPTSGSAQTINLSWYIPIALNTSTEFSLGLVNLQAPEIRATLELTTGALADIGSLITGLTGSFYVEYEYFDVPDPRVVQQPPIVLCRMIEETVPVTATGDVIYELPRLGNVLSVIQVVRLNGARTASVDSFSAKLNKTDNVYYFDRWSAAMEQRRIYGVELPTGVYAPYNWFSAIGLPFAGDFRDSMDTEAVTTTELITTITSGATLGSNNNAIDFVRRVLQVPVA